MLRPGRSDREADRTRRPAEILVEGDEQRPLVGNRLERGEVNGVVPSQHAFLGQVSSSHGERGREVEAIGRRPERFEMTPRLYELGLLEAAGAAGGGERGTRFGIEQPRAHRAR